MGLRHAFA
ncbi:hypothetical protein LDBPK_291740 [Leishmania donovani]|uniref:Uncharacterized protein n=1 Tax=Leishmania donovani TaxID=5661 RepID=E9BKX2_LEIDO|nr:hypothetical protein LDBPK_291740 [Leishmania donovani]